MGFEIPSAVFVIELYTEMLLYSNNIISNVYRLTFCGSKQTKALGAVSVVAVGIGPRAGAI